MPRHNYYVTDLTHQLEVKKRMDELERQAHHDQMVNDGWVAAAWLTLIVIVLYLVVMG